MTQTELEKQIYAIIDKVEYAQRHKYLPPKDRQKIMAKEIASLMEQNPDINTPFFGNSGVKIKQDKPAKGAEEILEFLSDKMYDDKIAHDYKDGKFDYRRIREWFLSQTEAMEQYRAEGLREELKNFVDWIGKPGYIHVYYYEVDEYLKQKP
jgi:hypothetical protein